MTNSPPTFTTPLPHRLDLHAGEPLQLSVTAQAPNGQPLQYSWSRGSDTIATAGPQLHRDSVEPADAGLWSVAVTYVGDDGETSQAATSRCHVAVATPAATTDVLTALTPAPDEHPEASATPEDSAAEAARPATEPQPIAQQSAPHEQPPQPQPPHQQPAHQQPAPSLAHTAPAAAQTGVTMARKLGTVKLAGFGAAVIFVGLTGLVVLAAIFGADPQVIALLALLPLTIALAMAGVAILALDARNRARLLDKNATKASAAVTTALADLAGTRAGIAVLALAGLAMICAAAIATS